MSYMTYQWRYKSKKGIGLTVLARTREVAEEVVEIWNTDLDADEVVKPRVLFFKKKVWVNAAPYELEREQVACASKRLERRRQIEAMGAKNSR